jgi:hypothetical protein
MTDDLTAAQVAEITAYVDIEAPPPDGEPVALVLFGTNQAAPVPIAAERYHHGTAPLIIEVSRRIADGSYLTAEKRDGVWR